MLVYLDDYRKAKSAKPTGHSRYDEELLCVNWNPAVSMVAMACYQTPHELSPQLPEDSAKVESAFMNRISALASQI